MLSKKYFSAQLLCLTFLLSASLIHAQEICRPPLPVGVPGVCNAWTSDPELAKHVTMIERTIKTTHESLQQLQATVIRQRGSRRLNFLLSTALLLETAYIIDKEDPNSIATMVKKQWNEICAAIQSTTKGS
jgi:hypothetical protein